MKPAALGFHLRRCSLLQRTQSALFERGFRTFAGREEFFPRYAPPEKIITFFCAFGRKLCEAFFARGPLP